jgi:hypothetical protein
MHDKPSHGIRIALKEPDEVLVQRQLEDWLDPGWCMTAPAGGEPKVKRKRRPMVWWIAGVLMFLGLAGLVTRFPMESLLSMALLLVIVIALVRQMPGKMPAVLESKNQ